MEIVNGNVAENGQFPYQVAITYITDMPSAFYCSGTIIAANWVLTAAHCCSGHRPTHTQVVAGDISRHHWHWGRQKSVMSEIILHPGWDGEVNKVKDDICLFHLKSNLTFTDKVAAIELPESSEETPVGRNATVSGWGAVEVKSLTL